MRVLCVYSTHMKNRTPIKKERRKTYNFTLSPSIRAKGDKLAFADNKSLSRFLEDLIEKAYRESVQGATA